VMTSGNHIWDKKEVLDYIPRQPRLLPKGTAYLTDVGMTGPYDSIIGVTVEAALGRFVTGMPARFESASGPARLNAIIITADPASGRALGIERLNLSLQEVTALAAHG